MGYWKAEWMAGDEPLDILDSIYNRISIIIFPKEDIEQYKLYSFDPNNYPTYLEKLVNSKYKDERKKAKIALQDNFDKYFSKLKNSDFPILYIYLMVDIELNEKQLKKIYDKIILGEDFLCKARGYQFLKETEFDINKPIDNPSWDYWLIKKNFKTLFGPTTCERERKDIKNKIRFTSLFESIKGLNGEKILNTN